MATTPTPTFAFDQLVQINPRFAKPAQRGVVFEVTAPVGYPTRRSTTVDVARLDNPAETGSGQPGLWIGIDHPDWVGTRDEAALRATKPAVPDLQIGQVITMSGDTTLYVVVGQSGDKYRAYALGGSTDGRYLRGINPAAATVIPLSELASHL